MLVCVFRAGKRAGEWSHKANVAEIIEHCKNFAGRWLEQEEWFLEDLPVGAKGFVETQLIVPPHNPNVHGTKISHELKHREKQEPDTVFVGVLTRDEYRQLKSAAVTAWSERQTKIRQHVEEMKPMASKIVRWEDLTAKMQARFAGTDLLPEQCWVWRPLPQRPGAKTQRTEFILKKHLIANFIPALRGRSSTA